MPRHGWVAITIACAACAPTPQEGVHAASPADAVVAGAMVAAQPPGETTETVYGWHLEVVGDQAKYFACSAVDACSFRAVQVNASSLVATKVVSRAVPVRDDGTSAEEVDVVRLTISHERPTKRGGVSSDPRGLVVR
jgi:hypothetical protein